MTKSRLFGLQLLFGWMNLVLAVPSIYLMFGMPLVMRQHGWSGTEIGLFQLAALPAIFKFLFAVPVQRVRLGQGHFVHWLLSHLHSTGLVTPTFDFDDCFRHSLRLLDQGLPESAWEFVAARKLHEA